MLQSPFDVDTVEVIHNSLGQLMQETEKEGYVTNLGGDSRFYIGIAPTTNVTFDEKFVTNHNGPNNGYTPEGVNTIILSIKTIDSTSIPPFTFTNIELPMSIDHSQDPAFGELLPSQWDAENKVAWFSVTTPTNETS
ncbi:hypothetical protein ACA910_017223 [Epithemia clementina (nom. ined.)]